MAHIVLYDAMVFCVYMLSMILRDVAYSVETKALAKNSTLVAAIADPLGDGVSALTSIITVIIIAHSSGSVSSEIAQIAGNMAGGFIGVCTGSWVSSTLDRMFTNYHRSPKLSTVERLAAGVA